MNERLSEKFNFRLMPRSLGLRIVMGIGLIAEIFFVVLLLVLDILPARVPVSGGILLRHLCVLAVFRRTS